MGKILKFMGISVLVALGALVWSFMPATLPVPADFSVQVPTANPPPEMRLSALNAGKMESDALFAWRGGPVGEKRDFGMGGILVQHPLGTLLFDTGFGRNVAQHFLTTPRMMQALSTYSEETPVADQLALAGIRPDGLVLTHAHWDHVSGIEDLPGVPVWVTQAEHDFIQGDSPHTALARSFAGVSYKIFEYSGGPYLGFERSLDVFGDGSVVLVPAGGHTPGSLIAFIATPDGKRYALLGDLVWQKEGVDLPAERPWLPRALVGEDTQQVRDLIVHMHQLQKAVPGLVLVPAHDRRVWESLPQLPAPGV